ERRGRRRTNVLEGELDLEHPAQRLRLVECDLRAGERALAAPEHQPAIGRDRLVARVARDLDIADGDPGLRGSGRRGLRYRSPTETPNEHRTKRGAQANHD